MSRYGQEWCDALGAAAQSATAEGVDLTLLYVVTDTNDGKVAFNLELASGAPAQVVEGKLPRGTKPDITVTIKEAVLASLWAGDRTRDEAFMAGDIKVEGAYNRWLDEIVPLFQSEPWAAAWGAS